MVLQHKNLCLTRICKTLPEYMYTLLYKYMMHSQLMLVVDAIKSNIFSTKYCCWLDLGYFKDLVERHSYFQLDDFSFSIVNFPFSCGNIPSAPAYGFFLSQLIRYAKACRNYAVFLYRTRLLTIRLLEQRYVATRLKSLLQKFYCRHHELMDRYGVSICTMKTDLFNMS